MSEPQRSAVTPVPPAPEIAPVLLLEDRSAASLLLSEERQRLVSMLAEPDSAAGLARRLGMTRQRINYHVKELEKAGLIVPVATRQRGNCIERLLRARARRFVPAPSALGRLGALDDDRIDSGDPAPRTARLSWALLVQMAARLLSDLARLGRRAERAGSRIPVLALESEVRLARPRDFELLARDLGEAVAEVLARHQDDSPGGRSFRLVLGAHPTIDEAAPTRGPSGDRNNETTQPGREP